MLPGSHSEDDNCTKVACQAARPFVVAFDPLAQGDLDISRRAAACFTCLGRSAWGHARPSH